MQGAWIAGVGAEMVSENEDQHKGRDAFHKLLFVSAATDLLFRLAFTSLSLSFHHSPYLEFISGRFRYHSSL